MNKTITGAMKLKLPKNLAQKYILGLFLTLINFIIYYKDGITYINTSIGKLPPPIF